MPLNGDLVAETTKAITLGCHETSAIGQIALEGLGLSTASHMTIKPRSYP